MAGAQLKKKDLELIRKKIATEGNFGAKKGISLEWWYLSGFFWEKDSGSVSNHPNFPPGAPDFGLHVAFFHSTNNKNASLVGHASMTDFEEKRYKTANNFTQIPNNSFNEILSGEKLHIQSNGWEFTEKTGKKEKKTWSLIYKIENQKFELILYPEKKIWFHGDHGVISRTGDFYEFYYSIPFIKTYGSVVDLASGRAKSLEGTFWFDHEIGIRNNISEAEWKWFGLKFPDGTAYMICIYKDGHGGVQILAEKYRENLSKDTHSNSFLNNICIKKFNLRRLKSGHQYPLRYEIDYYDKEKLITGKFTVESYISEQEFRHPNSGTRYWEGVVKTVKKEAGRSISGFGYLEIRPAQK